MCSNGDSDPASQLLTFRFKNTISQHSPQLLGLHPGMAPAALAEYQRLQLYDYAQAASRFRLAHPALMTGPYAIGAYASAVDGQPGVPYGLPPFVRFDPRARFLQEEPKPQHSYIGLIAMAILSSPEKKMVLSDIYQYILDNYPYFRNRGPGWRNSIRHNLSLNDCFVKAGRSANGKGHYWAIHPANVDDFKKGDFRRRKAQRKVRKHMGLSVPDDDDSPNPTPPPSSLPPEGAVAAHPWTIQRGDSTIMEHPGPTLDDSALVPRFVVRKRQFDVESLLAPDPVFQEEAMSKDDDPFKDIVDNKKGSESTPQFHPTMTPLSSSNRETGETCRERVRLCSSPTDIQHNTPKTVPDPLLRRKSSSPVQSTSSSPSWCTPVSLQNLHQVQAKLPLCNFSNGLVFPVTTAWVPSHQAMLTYELHQHANNQTSPGYRMIGQTSTSSCDLNTFSSNPVESSLSTESTASSPIRRWPLPPAHSSLESGQDNRN